MEHYSSPKAIEQLSQSDTILVKTVQKIRIDERQITHFGNHAHLFEKVRFDICKTYYVVYIKKHENTKSHRDNVRE